MKLFFSLLEYSNLIIFILTSLFIYFSIFQNMDYESLNEVEEGNFYEVEKILDKVFSIKYNRERWMESSNTKLNGGDGMIQKI